MAMAANGVSMPVYPDPNAACHRLERSDQRSDHNAAAYNECIKRDQEGYDTAVSVWDRLSDFTASICVKNIRADNPWAYALLGECAWNSWVNYDEPRQTPPPFQRWGADH